jgi:hypothetical protein
MSESCIQFTRCVVKLECMVHGCSEELPFNRSNQGQNPHSGLCGFVSRIRSGFETITKVRRGVQLSFLMRLVDFFNRRWRPTRLVGNQGANGPAT